VIFSNAIYEYYGRGHKTGNPCGNNVMEYTRISCGVPSELSVSYDMLNHKMYYMNIIIVCIDVV
jgi:hypothetical protein